MKHIRLKERGIGYQDLFNINRDDKFNIDSIKKINWAVLLEEKLELFLLSEDDARCQSFLRQLGVSEGRWYVCLHIRSDFYHTMLLMNIGTRISKTI